MKIKRLICALLTMSVLLSLSACAGGGESQTESSIPAPTPTTVPVATPTPGPTPEPIGDSYLWDEFSRAVWYGFLPDDLLQEDPDTTVVTWKQYCEILGLEIARFNSDSLPDWKQMTAAAPDEPIKRDGAVIALYYAGMTSGMDYLNYPPEQLTKQEYQSGYHFTWEYPIFEREVTRDFRGGGAPTQPGDWNYVSFGFNYLMGRVSCVTIQPALDVIDGDPDLESDLTLRAAAISAVRLYESDDKVALAHSERLLEYVKGTEEGQAIIAKAEARKAEILNSETKIEKSDTFMRLL